MLFNPHSAVTTPLNAAHLPCAGIKPGEPKFGHGQGLGIVQDIAVLGGASLKPGASEFAAALD